MIFEIKLHLISTCSDRSHALLHVELRVVSSAEIAIIQSKSESWFRKKKMEQDSQYIFRLRYFSEGMLFTNILVACKIHSFFIRTSKFCLRLAVLNFFFLFEAEMFLICSYFPDWTLQCHKEECQTEYDKNTIFHFFHSFSFK